MASSQIIDTDSEDELPAGWEERVTVDGKVYYANHDTKSTQWFHPTTAKRKKVAGELPYGWDRKINEEGNVYFVDHVNRKTTFTDPRLAFAVEDKDDELISTKKTVKQRFDGTTYAMTVLLGRDLTGKYAIVTGANGGIGYETVRALALHGTHVVMACRNMEKGQAALKMLRKERPNVDVTVMRLDLANLASVKQFAEAYLRNGWPLHYLILNAGVFSMPYTLTDDGYEATFQTNHLGHFYLTQLLTDVLIESAPARVTIVSAEAHRFCELTSSNISEDQLSPPFSRYQPIVAYNQSKMCNILFSNELNRRLHNKSVISNAVHPGNVVSTGITCHWWGWKLIWMLVRPFTKTKGQAAACTVFAATARDIEGYGGYFFNNCFNVDPAPEAKNLETARFLWDISERMISSAQTLKLKANPVGIDMEEWGERPAYEHKYSSVKVA